MARFYYLGPWVLDTKGPVPFHRAPLGAVGVVDLRRIDGSGVGFFTTEEPLTDSDYTAFGDDKGTRLDSVGMDDALRSTFAALVGIKDAPTSATLLDLLWDALTIHSDPDGVTGPKPIMPTSRGTVDLHLGGHSLVRSARVPRDPTALPHWEKVQRVLQSGFREVAEAAAQGETQKQQELHARWLGFQQEKYGLSAEVATALIVPGDMPRTAPKKPETTITDDFNTADSGTLGADLTWTMVRGDWNNASNQASYQNGVTADARAESDLSGSDHYAQIRGLTLADDSGFGPCARFDSSADTFYLGWFRDNFGGGFGRLIYKCVTGSFTEIVSDASYTPSLPEVYKVEANGSTIKSYQAGVEVASVTDTSISGGTRCGFAGYSSGAALALDDFEAADLGGAAATRGTPFGSRGTAFNGGRTFMGILR